MRDCVLRRSPGIVARRIAGETILVPVRRRAQEMGLFTLNAVATFVWESLDGTRSLEEIGRAVAGEFDVDSERAAVDVVVFAQELERSGCAVPVIEEAR